MKASQKLKETDHSKVNKLIRQIKNLEKKTGIHRTIFAACPNSQAVIRAALRAAKRNNAPIKFAATLNQVDQDGGYTGMTHRQFVATIRMEARAIHFTGPVIIAIDHGGPWLRDNQRTERWSLQQTMDWVKKSFSDAIDAGYDLIHVDPTVDIELPPGKTIPIERVVDRTIELIAHCENYRRRKNLPPIAYEVGTEEVHGGLSDLNVFRRFFELMKKGLKEAGYEDVWPVFVVGKVGTDLHTTLFDPDTARTLTGIAAQYGSFIKGHYTDNVENPEDYPASGMGAANVGPEFTEREYEALCELDEMEKDLVAESKVIRPSNIKDILWQEVIASNRWKKWLIAGEDPENFYSIPEERQLWLIKTGCRYIWENTPVVAARSRLYENLSKNGIEAEQIVLTRIESAMDKYFRSFNLTGLNDLLHNID